MAGSRPSHCSRRSRTFQVMRDIMSRRSRTFRVMRDMKSRRFRTFRVMRDMRSRRSRTFRVIRFICLGGLEKSDSFDSLGLGGLDGPRPKVRDTRSRTELFETMTRPSLSPVLYCTEPVGRETTFHYINNGSLQLNKEEAYSTY